MGRRIGKALAIGALLVGAAATARAGDGPRARYVIHAGVGLEAPQVDGTVDVRFTNTSGRTLGSAVILLFPNRFARPDSTTEINDFNRPFVYPREDFDPGGMEIVAARDAGTPVRVRPIQRAGVPRGCVVRVPIAPLPPGGRRRLTLRFRTRVPYRFGAFGRYDRQLTLAGGWYPYLAALGDDGTWRVNDPPPLADFEVHLTAGPALAVLVNGHAYAPQPFIALQLSAVHYVSLVAAPDLQRAETHAGAMRIVLYYRRARWTQRISFEPPPLEILLATLREIVHQRPAVLRPAAARPAAKLVVVEAPMRLDLTAPGEGMLLVSDRSLKVHAVLRPFHALQLAQAVYAELLRPQLIAREPDADYWWVSEGLTRVLARRFLAATHPGLRSVQDWINLFDIFAVVDRFESVPKIPFVAAYFEHARVADPLHEQVTTFNNALPPGRVVLGKLREEIGHEAFSRVVDRCVDAVLPFRHCAATAAGQDLDWLFGEWLQPYPALNYRFGAMHLNQPVRGGYGSTVVIERQASRPVIEPVTVRLRSIGGRYVDLRWNGRGSAARLSAQTPRRVCQVVIDPRHRLIEDRRDDDARPPTPQVVLDTADVEVSSTEFGFSGLVVARGRYDYRKDLALAAFYTNRSTGFDVGARRHWGPAIDAVSYRHNAYLFYGFQGLNGSFTDARHPTVHTRGRLAYVGARYDYTNVYSYENPTDERALRLYADWYDRALGGSFNYADWGASAVLTHPLWSERTIAAGQVLDGFSTPFGGSVVPNQGLYSLGGSRSIRGIGAEDDLGRNILLVRGEVRQDLYPEIDLNFLDLLVLRRLQVHVFADSGRVNNSAGRVYDPTGFAVGVGTGINAVYEFLGFFPSVAYLEVATRADNIHKATDVQVLFGTHQAF